MKVPNTKEGAKAARILINKKVSITFTACFELKQVLLADIIGANYIAPYLNRINQLGFDDVFIRKWNYYFDYSAAGFKNNLIGNSQILFSKPLK